MWAHYKETMELDESKQLYCSVGYIAFFSMDESKQMSKQGWVGVKGCDDSTGSSVSNREHKSYLRP